MSNYVRGTKRLQIIQRWLQGIDDPDFEVFPTKVEGKYIVKKRTEPLPEPNKEHVIDNTNDQVDEQTNEQVDEQTNEQVGEQPKPKPSPPKPKPKPLPTVPKRIRINFIILYLPSKSFNVINSFWSDVFISVFIFFYTKLKN